jgi:hypothetical protein
MKKAMVMVTATEKGSRVTTLARPVQISEAKQRVAKNASVCELSI